MKHVLFLINEKKDTKLNITKEIVEYLLLNNCAVYLEKSIADNIPNTFSYSENSKIEEILNIRTEEKHAP